MCVVAVLTAWGCAGATPSSVGSANASAAGLMEQLAHHGDLGLFESRYVARLHDETILFVGTKADSAIAYLCDPITGARWFTGTATGGQLDVRDSKGGHLTGSVTHGAIDATVAGVTGYDGPVGLLADDTARLARQADVPTGELVGGLVGSADTIEGVISVSASGLPQPSGSAATKAPITIGLRLTLGSRIDVTIATKPPLTTAKARAAESEVRTMIAEAEKKGGMMKALSYLAAVVVIIVAIVISIFTFDAIPNDVHATLITALNDASKLEALDPTANAYLSRSLSDFATDVKVTGTSLPRVSPSSSGGTETLPALGTLTFTTLSGGA